MTEAYSFFHCSKLRLCPLYVLLLPILCASLVKYSVASDVTKESPMQVTVNKTSTIERQLKEDSDQGKVKYSVASDVTKESPMQVTVNKTSTIERQLKEDSDQGKVKAPTPRERRMMSAHTALKRFHSDAHENLERLCYVGSCNFAKVIEVLDNLAEATAYWAILNCVKYRITCGEESMWQEWESWSDCSAFCGEGERTRWRHCKLAEYWGVRCKGEYTQAQKCTNTSELACLPHPAQPDTWGSWGGWDDCSLTCGKGGRSRRTRQCLPYKESQYCVGEEEEERRCIGIPVCPVNGGWSQWGRWSDCSVITCAKGVSYRTRTCTHPLPRGMGARCLGSSVELNLCDGPPCRFNDVKYISGFGTHSTIVYLPQPSSPFISILLHFRPTSSYGLLLRHTGIPHDVPDLQTSSSADVKYNKKLYSETYGDEEYISVYLEEGNIMVDLSINSSDPIKMEAGKARIGFWNIFRLLVVSDVVRVRVNEGENIVATLQDSPVRPQFVTLTHKINDPRYWGKLWNSDKDFVPSHPDAPMSSITRNTRAILASIKGKISLGKHKQELGFSGYISLLRVNFVEFSLKRKPESGTSSLTNPIVSIDVATLLPKDTFDYEEANLPHFDGEHRLYLPLMLVYWVKQPANYYQYTYHPQHFSASHLNPWDLGSLEVVFKPENGDSILLFNRGKHDLATQWKVVIEDGIRVKFILARRGGKVEVLTSSDTLRLGGWNKLWMLFFTNGEVRVVLNGAERSTIMLIESKLDLPGDLLIVGGHRKFNTRSVLNSDIMRRVSAFKGYIYSIKQNNVEYFVKGRQLINSRGMPTSFFMSKPLTTSFWYFKPAYQHEATKPVIEEKKLASQDAGKPSAKSKPFSSDTTKSNKSGFFRNIYNKVAQGFVVGSSESNATKETPKVSSSDASAANLRKNENVREIACVIPVSEAFTSAPSISWYKDDVPLLEDPRYEIRDSKGQDSLRSSLFLMPSAAGSRVLSGVYSCVVKDGDHHWLFMNHVVAVINNNIVNPDSAIYTVITFIRKKTGTSETIAIFIITGMIAGVLLFLVLLCILINWCKRLFSKPKRRKAKTQNKTKYKRRKEKRSSKPSPSRGWSRHFDDDVASSDSLLSSCSSSDDIIDSADLYDDSLFKSLM